MERSLSDRSGPIATRSLWHTIVRTPRWICDQFLEKRFDRKFGIDTAGKVEEVDYGTNCGNAEFAYRYEPIHLRIFRRILRDLPFPPEGTAFVDLGSGKGRALILASAYPFAKIVGVELSPALHEIAEHNTRTPRAEALLAGRLELHCMDAAAYELPDRDSVVFLYNPFAPEVLVPVLDRLVQHPHRLAIVYRNAKFAGLLDERPELELSCSTQHYRIYTRG